MELTRAWRRALAAMKTAVAVVTAVACITTITTPAFAGTTGVVKGTVTDTAGAPLAGVSIILRSPSGNYPSTTDSRGFYAITGVYADTYTASFEKSGYASQVVTGLSVFADQTVTQNEKLTKSLKTIASVTARSAASAFQPEQTVDTYTVGQQQIQNLQGSDFNISESNLLTSLPGVGYDSSGYPVIHGGRENEEGFEFEGVPYTDAFTNQFVNTLALPGSGLASAQLTPGVGDASVQSNGTGVINLVASRGTYPGYTNLEFRVGGPGFDHAFNGSMSYASDNGHISDYLAFAGAQSSPRYGDGTTPANLTGNMASTLLEADRETLNNLIFRFGKNNNQALQLFTDIGQHNFYQAYGGYSSYCFESCNPYLQASYGSYYGFTPSQVTALTGPMINQTSPTETLAQGNRAPATYYQPFETYKLGYTLNINPSTFLSADVYSVNAVTTFDFPTGTTNSLGLGDYNLLQGGHSLGGTIKLQKQINDKNLAEVGYEYAWRHPEYQQNIYGYAWLSYLVDTQGFFAPYDFISPTDPNGCPAQTYYGIPAAVGTCGYAYGANPTATQLQIPSFAQNSNINRRDASYYVNDKWDINDRLHLDAGVRVETSQYLGLPSIGLNSDCTFNYNPANANPNASYDPTKPLGLGNCPYNPNFSNITTQMLKPSEVEPRLGLAWQLGHDTALRFTYDRASAFPILGLVDAQLYQPDFLQPYAKLAPYSLNNNLLAAEGVTVPTFALANGTTTNVNECGIAPYYVPCTNYGQQLYWIYQNFNGVPYQPILPMTSNNYQVTLEHQFTKGFLNGVAISVAPWTRHQYNTEASVAQPEIGKNGLPLIANGNVVLGPASATNLGKEFANGVDVNITKENPVGLSGQWTMTYVNEFSSVLPTSGSEDFFPSIPYSSALAGNVYRVGFLSPFQTTLGLTYRTESGWRVNPRLTYNVGYPIGAGTLTSDIINGVAMNVPNTNVIPGGAATSEGIGPAYYVDPLNPGSLTNPNIVASRGNAETASPGGKLSPSNFYANITLEYAPKNKPFKVGFDVENMFNRYYGGPSLNPRYQPIATGIAGPLTGQSTHSVDYREPYANPIYEPAYGGNNVFLNFPNSIGRSYYFYYSVKI
jgi:hypothetical protein